MIDVGGVGFTVWIPLTTYRELPAPGETVIIHTHLYLREDEIRLFGFASKEEREIFQLLVGLSGIGNKVALDILSHLPVPRLVEAVQKDEPGLLCQVPGIGKKRAEKLIFDLKRISHPVFLAPVSVKASESSATASGSSGKRREAEDALITLGCKPQEAQRAIAAAIAHLGEDVDVTQMVKEGLKHR